MTYVPPPAGLARELMGELIQLASTVPNQIDPVVAASVISFAFVFIHPFMDGNGRLHRFLFHHALCQSGQMEKGLLLPVSVAMRRHEADYLAVLQQYSRPVRQRWKVRWIDEGQFDFEFEGSEALYRYWDATHCVEFGSRMAEEALEIELRQETEFLASYSRVIRAVNERVDVRGSDLAILVQGCLENNDVVSENRRKQYALRVPETTFDVIEAAARATSKGAGTPVADNDASLPNDGSHSPQA